MVGTLVSNKTVSAVSAIFAALGIMLAGSVIYNLLCEPEMTMSGITITSDGTADFGEQIPNPAYIGGALRTVFTVLLNILPTGQTITAANFYDGESFAMPIVEILGSVGIIIVTTAIGIAAFKKKDIK